MNTSIGCYRIQNGSTVERRRGEGAGGRGERREERAGEGERGGAGRGEEERGRVWEEEEGAAGCKVFLWPSWQMCAFVDLLKKLVLMCWVYFCASFRWRGQTLKNRNVTSKERASEVHKGKHKCT